MKKNLLLILAVLLTTFASAQVVVSILSPPDAVGNLSNTFAIASNSWSVADLEDPANAIIGELAVGFAEGSVNADGLSNDSCGCEPLTNPEDIAGNIAVIYRGDCDFGLKALYAQDAGAIGVMIVSRLGEDLINMLGGDNGLLVTIPSVFVLGDELIGFRPNIDNGEVNALIGNKNGLFENDLGITPNGVLRAEHFSHPLALSQDGNYIVQMGAEIINYGSATQSNISLSAVITKDESVLYNETSATALAIAPGDTLSFDLPPFAPDNYTAGLYKVTYAVVYSETDEFPGDNTISANFMIDESIFAYSRINPETGLPENRSGFRPTGTNESVHSCIEFSNPNAGTEEGLAVGMTFSASTAVDVDMTGITVDTYIYEWTAEFEDINDNNFDLSFETLEELGFGSFEYPNNDMANVNVYVPFEEGAVMLEDDKRYLFCINHFTDGLFTGFDNTQMDYTQNLEFYQQPLWPLESNGDWFGVTHFGTANCPAISVTMDFPTGINEETAKVDITPYPNPTTRVVNIPVGNNYGKTLINVYDIAGKNVKTLNISTSSNETIRVNVSDLENGAYLFKMNFEDGSFSNFNVIVNN